MICLDYGDGVVFAFCSVYFVAVAFINITLCESDNVVPYLCKKYKESNFIQALKTVRTW